MCALARPYIYIYIYIRVLLSCKINFLFDKSVGGKQLIVAAGTGWAYFILFYFILKSRKEFNSMVLLKVLKTDTEKEPKNKLTIDFLVGPMVESVTL